MSQTIDCEEITITSKKRVILQFGPPSITSGFRTAEYFEAILDPNMLSPGGDYIRFDQRIQNCELHGWQRVAALTVCEVLGDAPEYKVAPIEGYEVDDKAVIRIMAIKK